jgi:hypothetical protein
MDAPAQESTDTLREALKRVAVALKDADVTFALAGGYAAWARGAPEAAHDVDFLVAPAEAGRAFEALQQRGFEVVQPAEDWLFKVVVDGETVDVLHRTAGSPCDVVLEEATTIPVLSVEMPVLSATAVVTEKLLAMDEHYCDFGQVLPVARSLREQVEWPAVEQAVTDNAFAEAFLFLLDRLQVRPAGAGSSLFDTRRSG